MTDAAIKIIVKKIIGDTLCIENSKLVPEANFTFDFNADPLDLDELKKELEREFRISIPDEVFIDMRTVGLAIEHIEKAVNGITLR